MGLMKEKIQRLFSKLDLPSTRGNGKETLSSSGRVYNFRLDSFANMQGSGAARMRAVLELKTLPRFRAASQTLFLDCFNYVAACWSCGQCYKTFYDRKL